MADFRDWVEKALDEARERRWSDPEHRDVVRVRMRVDLGGALGEELGRMAAERGTTSEDLVREGLGYVCEALRSRRDGPFVGRP